MYFGDQIRALQSRYLIKQAERYLMPTPPFDKESGNWEESDRNGSLAADIAGPSGIEIRNLRLRKSATRTYSKLACGRERHHRCMYRPTGCANWFGCHFKLTHFQTDALPISLSGCRARITLRTKILGLEFPTCFADSGNNLASAVLPAQCFLKFQQRTVDRDAPCVNAGVKTRHSPE